MPFFYSFIETLLHSIWQSAILFLFYHVYCICVKKIHPLQKRNFLYLIILTQIIISVFTFFKLYNGYGFLSTLIYSNNFIVVQSFIKLYAVQIFISYSIIVSYRSLAVFYQWKKFSYNYKNSLLKANSDLKLFTAQKVFQLGIKRKVTLWYSTKIQTPITFGFLKPLILLPFSLVNKLSIAEIEAIILHELTHIKSKDYLLNWLLVSVEILFFFNPFLKLIIKDIELEREKNCDVQVLNFSYNTISYAQSLVEIAKHKNSLSAFQLNAVSKRSQLYKRISFFGNLENTHFNKGYKFLFVTFLMLMLLSAPLLIPITEKQFYNPALAEVSQFYYKPEQNETVRTDKIVAKLNTITPNKIEKINKEHLKLNKEKVFSRSDEFAKKSIDNIYQYASLIDTLDYIKQFIYNVETQNGTMTQSYKLSKVNGEWTLVPMWVIVHRKLDSLQIWKMDSVYNLIDSVQ
jgi:beta-lactamase regulating signal transducer with metallopeptidase domain